MFKRLALLAFAGLLAISLTGCAAMVMSMMADNAKAKQEVDIPYSQAIDIVKGAMQAQKIQFTGALIKPDIAEAKGINADGLTVRIYITRITDTRSAIAVRCGTSEKGKKGAQEMLQAIIDYADLANP